MLKDNHITDQDCSELCMDDVALKCCARKFYGAKIASHLNPIAKIRVQDLSATIRKIKLTTAMLDELYLLKVERKQISILNDDLVFATKNNTPISLRNYERFWMNFLSERHANIPYKNFHVLRHTHATELLAAGIAIIEVSRRLGHTKVSHTLDLYGHAIPNYDQQIAGKATQLYVIPRSSYI